MPCQLARWRWQMLRTLKDMLYACLSDTRFCLFLKSMGLFASSFDTYPPKGFVIHICPNGSSTSRAAKKSLSLGENETLPCELNLQVFPRPLPSLPLNMSRNLPQEQTHLPSTLPESACVEIHFAPLQKPRFDASPVNRQCVLVASKWVQN